MRSAARIGWRYLVVRAAGYRLSSLRSRVKDLLRARMPTTSPAAAARAEGSVTETLPPREVRLLPPPELGASDRRLLMARDVRRVPSEFVLQLREATLLGREGWVVRDGHLLDGIWQEAGRPVVPPVPRGRPASPTHLPGTTVSLLMPWLPNYYHWTVQAVPRVLSVRDTLADRVDDVDRWLVPGPSPAYVHEWLDVLGVPADRRVDVDGDGQSFEVEHLVVASVPAPNRWVPRETVDRIRAVIGSPGAARRGPGRRLLIHRTGENRRVLRNADDVVEALTRRGFEVVDPAVLPLAEEVATFAAADLVVGVHGAGLTNLVFCPPGAQVVEITPRALVYPTFAKLAAAAGVRHHMVPGCEPRLPNLLAFPDTGADVVADVPRLTALVDALIAQRTRTPDLTWRIPPPAPSPVRRRRSSRCGG